MRSLAYPLWRAFGGVVGVFALLGLARAVGFIVTRYDLMPGA